MFWLAVVWLSLQLPASADDLFPIDVAASKELADFHMGGASTIVPRREQGALLAPAVDAVPGVTAAQNGGPGGRTSFFIRGTEARHLSFTIDHLKVNDPSNTDRQFDAAFLTTPFLKEATLYKGPQTVLFGSDAFGGLMDLRTRKGESAPETRLDLNAGSFGTVNASLSQDWIAGSHQGTLTWTGMRTDGISRLNRKRFSATERDGAQVTQLTSSTRHHWAPPTATELLLSFNRGHSELDGFVDDNSHDRSRSDQYLLQQRTGHALNSRTLVSLRNGLARQQRELRTLAVGENSYQGELFQNELLVEHEGEGFKLLSGVASDQERFDQGDGERRAELNSGFLQAAFKRAGWTLQAGGRGERHSLYKTYSTGSAGVSWEGEGQRLGLQYSQGLKAPSLYQLYAAPLFGAPIGNRDLGPERNLAWELLWAKKGTTHGVEVSLFRNELSSLITFTNQGYINQDRFVAQGLEVQGEVNWKRFRVKPSATYQEFKESRTAVLRRPYQSAALEVGYFPLEKWELFSKLRAYGSRKDVDPAGNVVKLNGFETVNLGVRYKRGAWTLGAEVVNLLDRSYEEIYGYGVLPRSYFLHLGRTF